MNDTELKQFIESRGYMGVTVKSYTKTGLGFHVYDGDECHLGYMENYGL